MKVLQNYFLTQIYADCPAQRLNQGRDPALTIKTIVRGTQIYADKNICDHLRWICPECSFHFCVASGSRSKTFLSRYIRGGNLRLGYLLEVSK